MFFVAVTFAILAVVYDAILKRMPLVGNIFVASCNSIPIIYGYSIASADSLANLNPFIIAFAIVAFAIGLSNELVGTIRDLEGDRQVKGLSLPMITGIRPVTIVATLLLLCIVAVSPLSILYVRSPLFLLLVILCDGLIMKNAWMTYTNDLASAERYHVLQLLLGLLALVAIKVS
jgi:4-hydroxybenzoate polyprenyltransferase